MPHLNCLVNTVTTAKWIRIIIFKDGCFIGASTPTEIGASKAPHYATHQKP